MMLLNKLLTGALACAALSGAAHAEPWIVTVGGRASYSPPYEGADHDVFRTLPSFSLRRESTPYRFTPPDQGFTVGIVSNRWITVGPAVRIQEDRNHRGELQGFKTIDWAAEVGGFVDLWPAPWLRGHVEARRGITGHDGFVGDAGVDLVANGDRWNASVGPRIGVGDDNYMQRYFGVTQAAALASPYIHTPYAPDGGTRYYGGAAAVSYKLTDRLRATADVSYHRLSGDAGDSPLIALLDSRDQVSGGLALGYSFGVGR